MQWGQTFFQDVRHAHVTEVVTYERPGLFVISIDATFARHIHDVDGGEGVYVAIESWEVKTRRSEITFEGTEYRPRPGDVITRTIGGETFEYEVTADDNEQCFRDYDRFKDSIVIHTAQRTIT